MTMIGQEANALSKNLELRERLSLLIKGNQSNDLQTVTGCNLELFDVVITPNEINDKHGTGTLIRRIFANNNNIISIRSKNHYDAEHNFGQISFCLDHTGLSRTEIFLKVLQSLKGFKVKKVFCVPYFVDDILSAIAIKELFGVPLCTYIMDDQNIYANAIPDELMQEFLTKCSLRFATHPELRDAYENKYGLKFWLLPAVVQGNLLQTTVNWQAGGSHEVSKTGALVGSIWSAKWFELLRNTIKDSGLKIHWYGNNQSLLFTVSSDELEQEGITSFGVLPEEQLAERLKNYPYVVVPAGILDDREDCWSIGQLSLPGRILFILATSNTPIIVLGSEKTPAARFVKRFQIGVVCDYNSESFLEAVDYVTHYYFQISMREKAAAIAEYFSADGISDWIWRSLELREPWDLKFEKLMPRSPGDLVVFIEPPVPSDVYKDFVSVYQVMRRLKFQGFYPDFVVDVGASIGIWSYVVSKLFPSSRFILIDPLMSKYDQTAIKYFLENIDKAELCEVAVSNQSGKNSFQVSPDLWGSSLLNPSDFRFYETVEVEVVTLDNLANAKAISGRGILKVDVQCAEHLVLQGANYFLEQVDVIVVELSLIRYDKQAKILSEMMQLIEGLGYRYYDDVGCWRSPKDGTLLQKDIVFLRKDLLVPETSQGYFLSDSSDKSKNREWAIAQAELVDGYMSSEELAWLYENAEGQCVEIGSHKGRSTTAIALKLKQTGGLLSCIDPWGWNIAHREFQDNMRRLNLSVVEMKMTSHEAADKFADESLDFIFIDSSHEYEETKAEIQAWFPKLRSGGLLCGHDYCSYWQGVQKAVNELCPGFENPVGVIWAIRKI
jgi:FkbM family methyltransferase